MSHSTATSPGASSLMTLHAQAKRLSKTYLITLVILTLLCALTVIIINKKSDIELDNTALINIAGRQRTLSQRVAKCALALASPLDPALRSAYRIEAETVLKQWSASRRSLFALEITQESPGQLALFRETEPYHQAMISALPLFLADRGPASNAAQSIDPNLETILRAEAPFLEGMEQIVSGYQKINYDRLLRLRLLEGVMLGGLFLTLLGQAIFYFRSIERRLIAAADGNLILEKTQRQEAALLAALPDVVLVFDAKGYYRECRIPPGISPFKPASELIGRHYADVLPAEVAAEFSAVRSRLAVDHAVTSLTYSLPIAGSVHYYEARCTRFGEGEILCIARDITIRHTAQRALEEERLILRTIFEDSNAGYWDNDFARGTAFYSPSYRAMLGYSDEEFPNELDTWKRHVFPKDIENANTCFSRHVASRGQVPYSTQLRYRHKDGSTRYVVSTGRVISWGPTGKHLRVVGCQLDVTALYAAQESNKRLALVTRHSGSTVIFTDAERRITWVNDAFTQITGYTSSEVVGRNPSFLQGADTAKATVAAIREALSDGRNFRGEILNYNKQGMPYWIDVEIIPDLSADGRNIGYIGVQTDITSRKQAEFALRQRDERFAALSRHIPGVIYQFRLSKAGTPSFDFVSEGTVRVWGFTRDFVLSPEFTRFEHVPEAERPALTEAILYSATHLTPFEATHRSHNPIAGLRWIHASSTPTREANGDTVWHGYASDITDLVNAQQAVRNNEENLRGLVEGIPVGIFLKDAGGRWLIVNQRGLNWIEVPASDWRNKTNEDFATLYPSRAAFFQACSLGDEEAWSTGGTVCVERTTQEGFDEPITSEITKIPLFNPDGTRRALIMLVADISERKKAVALIERERRLFAVGPVAVLITTSEPRWPITYVSENIYNLLGYNAAELSSSRFEYEALIHPDDLPALLADTHARLADRSPFFESSYRLRHKDGSYRWFYEFTSPEYSLHGVCTNIRSYLFDQTKLKQTQQELRTREERIAAISRHVPGVLYEFKRWPGGGCFPYASEGMRELFALDPEEIREDGTPFFNRVHPGDLHALDCSIKVSVNACAEWSSEFRIIHPQRGLRWIHGSSSPRKLDNGSYVWDGYLFDNTDRKTNEENLLREGKREAIERLAGGIVHDFNNYLASITLSVDLLNNLPEVSPQVRKIIVTLSSEVDAATTVARQLLAFTKEQPLHYDNVLLDPFLKNCAAFALRGSAMEARMTLHDPGMTLESDPDILRQIIFNLILNSRQAMNEKGIVMLGATKDGGGTVTIRVADTGPGIPPSEQGKIFEPYFTTKSTGSGLGLFVVRSLIRRLGGDIALDPTSRAGAVFVLTLPPRTEVKADTPPPLPRLSSPPQKPIGLPQGGTASPFAKRDPLHVLLLEDEPGQTMLLCSFFETVGIRVDCFTDGKDLLAAAKDHREKGDNLVCMLDISVRGGEGGLDIAPALRSLLPKARIFLVSGYSDEWRNREKSLERLNIGFIGKPYHLRDLRARLKPNS